MSFEYTIFEDDDPTKEVIYTTSLSNTTHADWQELVGLDLLRTNSETGEVRSFTFHTMTNDPERLSFDAVYWLNEYFEKLGDEEPHSPLLQELYDHVMNSDSDAIFV